VKSIEKYREQLVGIIYEVSSTRFTTFLEKVESVNTYFEEEKDNFSGLHKINW
jgi:hypothetical protein